MGNLTQPDLCVKKLRKFWKQNWTLLHFGKHFCSEFASCWVEPTQLNVGSHLTNLWFLQTFQSLLSLRGLRSGNARLGNALQRKEKAGKEGGWRSIERSKRAQVNDKLRTDKENRGVSAHVCYWLEPRARRDRTWGLGARSQGSGRWWGWESELNVSQIWKGGGGGGGLEQSRFSRMICTFSIWSWDAEWSLHNYCRVKMTKVAWNF